MCPLAHSLHENDRIVVSKEYHFEWHEAQYKKLESHLITSDRLKEGGIGRALEGQMKVQAESSR